MTTLITNPRPQPQFSTWKTIKLGTHKDTKSLKEDLEKNGLEVNDWAADIMTKPAFLVAKEETTVDLVNVSAGELGFTKATKLRDIYARAIKLGLSLRPAEVGPQLRLQYPDQPYEESLRIAMEPISDSDGDPAIFDVENNRGRRSIINMFLGYPERSWYTGARLVFRKQN